MDHHFEKHVERNVPQTKCDGEGRHALVEVAAHYKTKGGEHRDGCNFAAQLNDEAPLVLRTGGNQLILSDQRKQIIRPAFWMDTLADRVVDRPQVDYDSGLQVTERNAEEQQRCDDARHKHHLSRTGLLACRFDKTCWTARKPAQTKICATFVTSMVLS